VNALQHEIVSGVEFLVLKQQLMDVVRVCGLAAQRILQDLEHMFDAAGTSMSTSARRSLSRSKNDS
jgi:hypothetical protein